MGSNVSGESRRIDLVGDDDAFLARAVETLDDLPSELPRWAVVGGLGVYLRIGDVHRATDDLDTVSADRGRSLEILAAAGAERGQRGLTLANGVHLDVIEVREASEPGSPVELARRWALDTAERVEVSVSVAGETIAQARLPIATTAALVAMKLHALPLRTNPLKRANDGYDVVRLVEAEGPAVLARGLSRAPNELGEATIEALRYHFSTHGDLTLQRIRLNRALPDAATLVEDRVHDVARAADALEAFGTGRMGPRPSSTEPPGIGL